MAVLLFLLAVAGGVLVGDLVLENTDPGSVTVLDRSFTGYSEGELLAAVAVLGFIIGVLAVASVGLRRTRRTRRRELRELRKPLLRVGERRPRSPAPPTDPYRDPVYDEARRAARLRSDMER